jgi:hypothetical protein
MPSIQCRKCFAVIKSTHRHDFVWCDCKSVAIDGGKDYTRIIGSPDDVIVRQENKMKYTKTKNIWAPDVDFHALQTGQWVSAGEPLPDRSNCGRFYGVKPGGTVVVVWTGNAKRRGWKEDHQSIHHYAKGK